MNKKELKNASKGQLQQFRDVLTDGMSSKPVEMAQMSVNTHIANHIDRIGIDSFARSLMEDTFPIWMPKNLQIKLKESLRGFDSNAALWIAECLLDCYSGQSLSTTGIRHIDEMLWSLYSEILKCAREKGIRIANHR